MTIMENRLNHDKILVLAEKMYEDLELWYPVLRLREEGARVVIAGTGDPTYHGKHGYPVMVEMHINQALPSDFDAVVIPGGYAPDYLRRHSSVLAFIKKMHEDGKVIAAICHAPWVLISAGIVHDKRMTCFPSIKDDVINAGAHYEDTVVVRDDHLITSRSPPDLGAFCQCIIQTLLKTRSTS